MVESEKASIVAPEIGTVASQPAGKHDEALAGHRSVRGTLRRYVDKTVGVILGLALSTEVAVILGNIFGRKLFGISLLAQGEILQLDMMIIMFVGGAAAYARDYHMSVHIVRDRLPTAAREVAVACSDWTVLFLSAVLTIGSIPVLADASLQKTAYFGLPFVYVLLPLTIGMGLVALYAGDRLLSNHRRPVLLGAGIVATPVLALLALTNWFDVRSTPWMQQDVLIVVILLLVLALLMGMPVVLFLAGVPLSYGYISASLPLKSVPLEMTSASDNYILIAIPFFVLAGLLMAQGGLGSRITDFIDSLVGHVRGGNLQVIVISMYVFSGLSGSKLADMAAVGTTLEPMAASKGYKRGSIAAVLAASAVMGETIPPSLGLIILGSVTSLSIVGLFLAGVIPAAVLAAVLMLAIYVGARRSIWLPHQRRALRSVGKAAANAVLPALLPVILVGGVLLAIATPTEVSSFAVVYALVISLIVYRELPLHQLVRTVQQATALTGMILFTVATALTFSSFLSLEQIPQQLLTWLSESGSSKVTFLITSLAAVILMGVVTEGIGGLVIFAPVLVPIAQRLGISGYQYGILLVIANGLGAFIPPVGVGAYFACLISKATMQQAMKPLLGYLLILLVGIIFIAVFPAFSTWLPSVVLHKPF